MENIVSRLNEIKAHYHFSDRSFAIKIGVIPQTLGNQLKGRRAMSLETIVAILSNIEGISSEWLLRGEGSMLRTEPATISIGMNKVGNGSAVAIGNGASSSISDSEILKENARLREENKQLRERCDKLTDKLLGI